MIARLLTLLGIVEPVVVPLTALVLSVAHSSLQDHSTCERVTAMGSVSYPRS